MSYAGKTPTFTSVTVGDIEIVDSKVYYGDKDTDGSFRTWKDGANLVIEIRVGGVWEPKDTIEP